MSHVNQKNFFRQIFEKYSNIKFHKNRPKGTELLHTDRWTDKLTEGQTQQK